jgi:hypothetical protein
MQCFPCKELFISWQKISLPILDILSRLAIFSTVFWRLSSLDIKLWHVQLFSSYLEHSTGTLEWFRKEISLNLQSFKLLTTLLTAIHLSQIEGGPVHRSRQIYGSSTFQSFGQSDKYSSSCMVQNLITHI